MSWNGKLLLSFKIPEKAFSLFRCFAKHTHRDYVEKWKKRLLNSNKFINLQIIKIRKENKEEEKPESESFKFDIYLKSH